MRLGIFGGTFDPVHYGHLLLAECCREQWQLDQVWFLPAAVPPHKQDRELTPANCGSKCSNWPSAGTRRSPSVAHEIDRGGVNYTVDTLAHFRSEQTRRASCFS